MTLHRILPLLLVVLSLSASAQEETTLRLFDEVTFYDGYLFEKNPDKDLQDGILMALNPNITVSTVAYQTAYDKLMEMFSKSDAITLAEYRTELGVSRKFALFFLDYLDAQKITKMVGDKRVRVRKPT